MKKTTSWPESRVLYKGFTHVLEFKGRASLGRLAESRQRRSSCTFVLGPGVGSKDVQLCEASRLSRDPGNEFRITANRSLRKSFFFSFLFFLMLIIVWKVKRVHPTRSRDVAAPGGCTGRSGCHTSRPTNEAWTFFRQKEGKAFISGQMISESLD